MMIILVIVSITAMDIVAFVIGFLCGKDAGLRQAQRASAFAALQRDAKMRRAVSGVVRRPGPFPANRIIREGHSGVQTS